MKKKLLLFLLAILAFGLVRCSSQNKYERKAIQSAETYVTSQFYNDFGESADKLKSEVIYSDKNDDGHALHLVAVKCYWNGNITGSYCVYCKLGTFRNSTKILPSGYDFNQNIDSLKALFGIM